MLLSCSRASYKNEWLLDWCHSCANRRGTLGSSCCVESSPRVSAPGIGFVSLVLFPVPSKWQSSRHPATKKSRESNITSSCEEMSVHHMVLLEEGRGKQFLQIPTFLGNTTTESCSKGQRDPPVQCGRWCRTIFLKKCYQSLPVPQIPSSRGPSMFLSRKTLQIRAERPIQIIV